MVKLLTQHNLIPYLLIVIMSLLLWMAWDRGNDYKAAEEQARVDQALAIQATSEDIQLLQDMMKRKIKIKQISKQRVGKYEIIIAGDK